MSIPQTIATLTRRYGFTLAEARELAYMISADGFKSPYIRQMLRGRRHYRSQVDPKGEISRKAYEAGVNLYYLKNKMMVNALGEIIHYRPGMHFDATGRLFYHNRRIEYRREGSKRIWRLVRKYEKDYGQPYESPWKKKRHHGDRKPATDAPTLRLLQHKIDQIKRRMENTALTPGQKYVLNIQLHELIEKTHQPRGKT